MTARHGTFILNYLHDALDRPALSGGRWAREAPLSRLYGTSFSDQAQTVNAQESATEIVFAFSRLVEARGFYVARGNWSKAATWELQASYDPTFATDIVAAVPETEVYGEAYRMEDLDFEDERFWDGKIADRELQRFPMPIFHVFPANVLAPYWRLRIRDQRNPERFLRVAGVGLGPVIQPSANYERPHRLSLQDASIRTTGLGGADFHDVREKRRIVNVRFPGLPTDEALARIFDDLQGRLGIAGQFFWCADPGDTLNRHRVSFLATLDQLDPLEAEIAGERGVSLQIREVVA